MSTHSPRSFRWLFPTLLLASPLATGLSLALGVPGAVAMTATVLAMLALVVALERRWPFRASWGERPADETRTDVVYVALASLPDRTARLAAEALTLAALSLAGAAAPSSSSWAEGALRGLGAFLLADLAKYGLHRASHEVPWLWRFHVAHHQPRRVDALNALRLHPVNIAYNAAADALAMTLLQVPPAVAATLAALRATVGVLQHANLDLDAQRQWLFNAPSYHRTHHAEDVAVANHNYASSLLVWDRLFGTLLRAEAPAVVGVASPGHRLPVGYLGQTLYPLCTDTLDTTCVWARLRAVVR